MNGDKATILMICFIAAVLILSLFLIILSERKRKLKKKTKPKSEKSIETSQRASKQEDFRRQRQALSFKPEGDAMSNKEREKQFKSVI